MAHSYVVRRQAIIMNDDLLKVKTGIERDSRSKLSAEFMAKKLKKQYKIKVYKENFNSLEEQSKMLKIVFGMVIML